MPLNGNFPGLQNLDFTGVDGGTTNAPTQMQIYQYMLQLKARQDAEANERFNQTMQVGQEQRSQRTEQRSDRSTMDRLRLDRAQMEEKARKDAAEEYINTYVKPLQEEHKERLLEARELFRNSDKRASTNYTDINSKLEASQAGRMIASKLQEQWGDQTVTPEVFNGALNNVLADLEKNNAEYKAYYPHLKNTLGQDREAWAKNYLTKEGREKALQDYGTAIQGYGGVLSHDPQLSPQDQMKLIDDMVGKGPKLDPKAQAKFVQEAVARVMGNAGGPEIIPSMLDTPKRDTSHDIGPTTDSPIGYVNFNGKQSVMANQNATAGQKELINKFAASHPKLSSDTSNPEFIHNLEKQVVDFNKPKAPPIKPDPNEKDPTKFNWASYMKSLKQPIPQGADTEEAQRAAIDKLAAKIPKTKQITPTDKSSARPWLVPPPPGLAF